MPSLWYRTPFFSLRSRQSSSVSKRFYFAQQPFGTGFVTDVTAFNSFFHGTVPILAPVPIRTFPGITACARFIPRTQTAGKPASRYTHFTFHLYFLHSFISPLYTGKRVLCISRTRSQMYLPYIFLPAKSACAASP